MQCPSRSHLRFWGLTYEQRGTQSNTAQVMEFITSHIPALNTLGLGDNLGCFKFVVRSTPTHLPTFLYCQRLFTGNGSGSVRTERDSGITIIVHS